MWPFCAPVHWAAGSDLDTNFGFTSLAAPHAASSSVSRYSRTEQRVLAIASQSTSSLPSAERCLFASALIRLASVAKPRLQPAPRRCSARAEQTEALDEEARSAWDALSSRIAQQAWIDRRLDDLALIFARHDAGKPLELTRPIGRPRVWTARRTALQIAVADQSISHTRPASRSKPTSAYTRPSTCSRKQPARSATAGAYFRR